MSIDLPRIQFVTTDDGVRIAYGVMGESAPLVLMPGWVSHVELNLQGQVGLFMRQLARYRTVITYDGRGTGLSDRNVDDVSLHARVKDLEAVAARIPEERFTLFAWSQSTPAALVYAAEHPERVSELILFASFCEAFGRHEDKEELLRALLGLIRAEWGVGIRTTMGFTHPDADLEEQRQALYYLGQSATGEVAARILEEGMFEIDVSSYVPRVQAPALVLHRRRDNAVPVEAGRRVAALLPDARFVLLEGDHHIPFEGGGDPVMQTITEFLGIEVEAPAAPVERPAAPAAPPVTLLFTDMEGSTTLTERLGDAQAQELVRAHNTIVRGALAAHGGREVKHTGDGIMASFAATSSALECAVAIQRTLAGHNHEQAGLPIRVRIGVNTGEPVQEEDDLFGTAVQLARRICDLAEPGQIVVSNVVRELVAGKGFLFGDRGEVALRGFEDPVRVYELRWEQQ
jgi:class 3 adenylate cyclase/pimeloyl-ACP methyl ester carboxylesterase